MKKRIFNTAVALVAAMSLSTAAFAEAAPGVSGPGASDPGVSNPGWSDLGPGASDYEETVDLTGLADDAEVILGSAQGLAIEGTRKDFPAEVTKVTLVSSIGKLKDEPAKEAKKVIQNKNSDRYIVNVSYGISVTLLDQDGNVIEPVNPLTVYVVKTSENEKSNGAAYISDDSKTVETIVKKADFSKESTFFKFVASHFSKYYLFQYDVDEETTTTTKAPGGSGSGGGFDDPGNGGSTTTAATTTAPDAVTTTTKAPEVTTKAPADVTTKAPADVTTKAPSNGGNTPDDGNNSNVGNDGNGNGPDKNQATGVVLAVIPAAIAATAVVISKKRK